MGNFIKNSIKSYKLRNDIIDKQPSFKHLWFEIKFKSSKQSCLLGVLYQPNFDMSAIEEWVENLINSQNHHNMAIQDHCSGRFQHELDETK